MQSNRTVVITRLRAFRLKDPHQSGVLSHGLPSKPIACAAAIILTAKGCSDTSEAAAAASDLMRFVSLHFALFERHLSMFGDLIAPSIVAGHAGRYSLQHDDLMRTSAQKVLSHVVNLCTVPRLAQPLHSVPQGLRAELFLSALKKVVDFDTPATQ